MSREAKSVEELEHYALRNALYHMARRQFLEFMGRLTTFVVILGGTATVLDILPSEWRVAAGVLVTAVGSIQLVFDFPGFARDHRELQRRYYDIIGKLHEAGDLSAKARFLIMGELSRVSGEEPPTLRALDAIAFNQATDSLFGDSGKRFRVSVNWFQSLTAQILPHNNATFDERMKDAAVEDGG